MAVSLSLMLTRSRTRISPLPLVMPGRIPIPKPASLLEAIQSALQSVPIQSHPIAADVNGLASLHRMLLVLLVYCYATEIYSSKDVRNYVRTDATCLAVLGGGFVFLTEIRAFRKTNRSALEQCLIAALRFIEQQAAGVDMVAQSSEDTLIAEEARRRILFAACLDSMELDEACFSC